MSNFAKFIPFILEEEGGAFVSKNPKDPGGVTKFGVSIRFAGSIFLDLNGDDKTTAADIIAIDEPLAISIYRTHFWDKMGLDRFHPAISAVLFDACVNQGVGAASRDLQSALEVKSDGKIGPATMQAYKYYDIDILLTRLIAFRGLRYAATKNFDTFGKGWMRRLMRCALLAAKEL